MIRYLAIIENTFREGIAKKTILTILILNTVIIGFFLLALNVTQDVMYIFGEEIDQTPDEIIRIMESGVVAFFYQVAIFIGIFSIASFFPSMQEKGTVDLLLSRPMSRFNIYLAKFIGCMLIVLLIVAYLILGTWAVIWLKTGRAHIEYLYTIPIFMLIFFVFAAFVSAMGLITRNSTSSAIATIFIPYLFSAIMFGFHVSKVFRGNKFWYNFFEFFYTVLPKTVELTDWNVKTINLRPIQHDMNLQFAIWSTVAFGVVCYVIGAAIFQKRSY